MSWPTYPLYMNTGVEWLGDLPSGWRVTPLKNVATVFPSNVDKHTRDGEVPVQLCNYTDVYRNDTITGALDFMEATATVEEISKFTLREGDTIITKDSETADDIGLSAYVGESLAGVLCGYHLSVVRPASGLYGRFVKRLFDSHYLKAVMAVSANGLTRVGLGQYAIDNLDIPLPPVDEQRRIADFLDDETAKIDALIAKQEQLIATLREDRTATITHAVTKGLDPSVEMIESGVPWLGAIPKHWQVMQSRRLFSQRKTRALPGDDQLTASQKYGVIPQKEFMEREGAQVTQVILNPEILKHVEAGDFVISMRSFQGGIEYSAHSGAVSSAYVPLIPKPVIAADLFKYALKSDTYVQALQSTSNLVRDGQALRFENFSMVPLPLLPIDEQRKIASFLDTRCGKIDGLVTKACQMIGTLREYRSALITDAVTGKIDVRGVA